MNWVISFFYIMVVKLFVFDDLKSGFKIIFGFMIYFLYLIFGKLCFLCLCNVGGRCKCYLFIFV